MTLRVAQFSLKIVHLSFSMGPRGTRAYGLLPRLCLLPSRGIACSVTLHWPLKKQSEGPFHSFGKKFGFNSRKWYSMFRMKFKKKRTTSRIIPKFSKNFFPINGKFFLGKKNWCRLCVVVLFSHICHVRKLWRSERP